MLSEKENDDIILKKSRIDLISATKPRVSTKTFMWLVGVLFISTGVGIYDYRAGLIIAGLLLLLTSILSD